MPVTPYCKKKNYLLPIFLKYLISLFIDLKIMKKTGKNTLLKLEGLKNLAQQDEFCGLELFEPNVFIGFIFLCIIFILCHSDHAEERIL